MSVVHRFKDLQRETEENFGEKIVALRRDIHREPELGFDTEKTAEKVLAAIDGLPLDVETGVARNGIVATLKGDGNGPTASPPSSRFTFGRGCLSGRWRPKKVRSWQPPTPSRWR